MAKSNKPVLAVQKPFHKKGKADSVVKNRKPSVQLEGARFRWLNESLYTESSQRSFELFQSDPSLFETYHLGFRSQASAWPNSPVDDCVAYLLSKLSARSVVGDFGCGDAKLAEKLKGKMTVHSFDLISVNPLVTACNIAEVPLGDACLDAAVFSLSLMGTDWPKFIAEAQRCLKTRGILYIAEVQSRLLDFGSFIQSFKPAFEVIQTENNKDRYFVKVVLRKVNDKPLPNQESSLLKPCLYKKR